MITKQLKSLLMIPSPNAPRPRPGAPTSAAAARAPSEAAGAARADAPAPPEPSEAHAPRPTGEQAASRAPAVPSYLRAAADAPSPAAASISPAAASISPAAASISLVPEGMRHFKLHGTERSSDAPRGPALPFKSGDASTSTAHAEPRRSPPAPVDAASLVPPGMRGFTELRGTQPTSAAASGAPVLPFGPPAPPEPARPASPTAVLPALPAPPEPARPAPPTAVLPAVPAPPEPADPAVAMALVPKGMRGFTSLTGTHPTSGAPSGAPLPFASGPRAAPAAPSAPPPTPALSLEQYASLCADLAASPGDAEALFARYGLGRPEERAAVDAFWRDRLARDPAAHRRWQELYSQHRSRSAPAGESRNEPR
ncbi:hypothetical protein WMF11_14130 [Sorangium sp. So ce295]|uniref:hypothetical protein n=1 Tax=Sorangium sp. So ce295 TaxID=3133295 RepID=UPI003F61AE33